MLTSWLSSLFSKKAEPKKTVVKCQVKKKHFLNKKQVHACYANIIYHYPDTLSRQEIMSLYNISERTFYKIRAGKHPHLQE